MNELVKKAVETLQTSEKKVSEILKEFSKNYTPEDFADLNAMYDMNTELKILISQYSDEAVEKQGNPVVHNDYAMVEIAGIEITGNIQFQLRIDDEWVCGHRANSQYGQIFINSKRTVIITDDLQGRVLLPLRLDDSIGESCSAKENSTPTKAYAATGTCAPTGNCAPTRTCAPTGNCTPTGTCAPTGNCTPTGTCAPVGTCAPMGTCAPTGNCAPTGTCAPTGNCCSPNEWIVC